MFGDSNVKRIFSIAIILSADFECSDADYSDDLLMVNCNSY